MAATTFYSRYKRYKIAGPAVIGTIDFSGGKQPPQEGDGEYTTADAGTITFLRGHSAYGVDFAETKFTEPTAPGLIMIADRDTVLDLLVNSVAFAEE